MSYIYLYINLHYVFANGNWNNELIYLFNVYHMHLDSKWHIFFSFDSIFFQVNFSALLYRCIVFVWLYHSYNYIEICTCMMDQRTDMYYNIPIIVEKKKSTPIGVLGKLYIPIFMTTILYQYKDLLDVLQLEIIFLLL